MAREIGTVKSLILGKGFGFVRRGNGLEDLFFHVRDLVNLEWDERLQELPVSFDVVEHRGKQRAVNVKKHRA